MDRSGAPTSLLNIMEEFKEQGYGEIDVIAMRGGEQTARFKNLSERILIVSEEKNPSVFSRLISVFTILYFIVKNPSYDAVLINSLVNLRGMAICRLLKQKTFVYVRESEEMVNTFLSKFRKYLMIKMNGIICVSNVTKDWVSRYVSKETCVRVIHNGIKDINNKTMQFKSKANNVVGIVGYLDERKGVDYLLAVMHRINKERPGVSFLIIGDIIDVDYKNKILDFAKATGKVNITGITNNVINYINECTLTLMLSRQEALPRVVMESCAAGVPVIAFNVAGTKEMLPPNYPYLYEVGDVNSVVSAILSTVEFNNSSLGIEVKSYIETNFNQKKLVFELYRLLIS